MASMNQMAKVADLATKGWFVFMLPTGVPTFGGPCYMTNVKGDIIRVFASGKVETIKEWVTVVDAE